MKEQKTSSVIGISSATFLSRIFGLIREQIFAFLLGATNFADAFLVAFRIPNLLRDLFAEGALSTAFVPTFTHYLLKKGRKKAFYLSNLIINSLILIIGILIILGYVFTPEIVKLIAPGFLRIKEKFFLTVVMTRILLPFLLFVSLASVIMGILNVHHKFFIPAFAPAVFNITIIAGGIIIITLNPSDYNKAILWAIAALFGGMMQLVIQLPSAKKLGYRYQPVVDIKFQEQGVRRIFKLMLPAVIGLAAVQINIIINTILASLLPTGSVAYLNYGFRLIQLPIGVFGVAIATVTTAYISKDIVRNEIDKLKKNIADSIKLTSFLTIPAIVYYFLLGDTIIALLFQHGRFTAIDTVNTFKVLQFYSLALFFYSSVKIFAPVFYASGKSYKPVIASILAVITNLSVSLSTYKTMGVKGLALGVSCGAIMNFSFLGINFILQFGKIRNQKILVSIFKHIVSAICMGIAGVYAYNSLKEYGILIAGLAPIIISGIIYAGINFLLKTEEFSKIINIAIKK